MKFLVGVKMVPRTHSVTFSAGVNRIVREGVATEMNPSDRSAILAAITLRARTGGEVVAFTMGPPSAVSVLEEAGRLGADRLVHLEDMRFAGADTLATSRAIAQLCRRELPDLVVFGRVAIDGGTAQVPAQVAELADLPLLPGVDSLEPSTGSVRAHRLSELSTESWEVPLPAVVSIEPSWTSAAQSAQSRGTEAVAPILVETLDADELGGDDTGYGIRGSATYVQQVTTVTPRSRTNVIGDAPSAARALWQAACSPRGYNAPVSELPPLERSGPREIWAVVLPADDRGREDPRQKGLLKDTSTSMQSCGRLGAEAIACAKNVAARLQTAVVAVVLGEDSETARRLAAGGADRVLVVRSATATGALARLVEERAPLAVVGMWTDHDRECLARVAARLSLGLTGDFVGLDVATRPGTHDVLDLVWLKPAWAGTALARVVARTTTAMGTLRPGAVPVLAQMEGRTVEIEDVHLDLPRALGEPTLVHSVPRTSRGIDLDGARVVVCVGARAAPFAGEIRRVAGALGWAVGGTAETVAQGYFSADEVVDSARCSLSPALALAIGLESPAEADAVRGAVVLASIDPDPRSPAHEVSDLRITCAVTDVLSELLALVDDGPATTAFAG